MTERCKCGHSSLDHPYGGSCAEGTKRCRCMAFKPQPDPWVEDKEAGAIG